jgi:putative ubiquitin-RnfH superfamily antitoxin RatB of RatAB toxin-antitoxin module
MSIRITVVYSPARREVKEISLTLPDGASVLQAIQASGMQALYPELDLQNAAIGVWGRKAHLKHVLRNQDRVEVYRPLRVNPKVARRERFAKQGARTAGLFARKRAGAKAGY